MMKHFAPILIALLLASCSAKDKGDNQDLSSLKERLATKKEQLNSLEKEVSTLEKEILEKDTLASSQSQRSVLVQLKEMKPVAFDHYVKINGTVEADKDVMVSPEAQGKIEKIHVEKGDRVKKGEVLAVQSMEVLKNQLAELRTQYDHAMTIYEKQKRLWKEKNIGSEVEYLNAKNRKENLERKLETLQEQLELATIKSPISGVVEDVYLKEGAFSSPQQPLARVVNLDELYINANVSESYLSKLQVGDSVLIHFPNVNVDMKAPIVRIGDVIDPQNRTFKVRIKIGNVENDLIKANALASLRITDFSSDSAMLVPSGIIQRDMEGDYLYTKEESEDGPIARKTYVKTGYSQKGKIMVDSGLTAGDKVLVMGYDKLTDGTNLRINNPAKSESNE